MFQSWLEEERAVGPFPLFGDEEFSLTARVSGNAISWDYRPRTFTPATLHSSRLLPRAVSSTIDPRGDTQV